MDDLRIALRSLFRNPGFLVVATLTLALGIGANTAIFSVVNGVLLRPLPYGDPDGIVTLFQSNFQSGDAHEGVSPANFLDWKERSRSFSQMAAFRRGGMDLAGSGHPETLPSIEVSEGFFEVLRVGALHGRVFHPRDYEPGRNQVVILEHGFWRRRFGADPAIVGRTLRLDGQPYVVVGVMPPEFDLMARLWATERRETQRALWTPFSFDARLKENRRTNILRVVARLRDGVSPQQARAEMDTLAAAMARQYPDANRTMGITLLPLRERLVGAVRPMIFVVFGSAAMVLLVACANISNLLLARSTTRRSELAVRVALGASRGRMFRLLLTEGMILALLGGAAGVLLAHAGTRALKLLAPADLPRISEVAVDYRVTLFSIGTTFVAALLFSGFPALHFSRAKLMSERQSTASGSLNLLRGGVVAAQIAFALVLLTGAGLLVRSFVSLMRVNPGFRTERLMLVQLFIWDRYDTAAKRSAFVEQARERLEALPGVTSVGAATAVPFAPVSIDFDVNFLIAGKPSPPPDNEPSAYFTVASVNYFEAIGMPLVAGRTFTRDDSMTAPRVAVINRAMATRFWPGENPIGKEIDVRYGKLHRRRIVGIVGDVRHTGLDAAERPNLFVPHAQAGDGGITLVVRTSLDPAPLVTPVREALWEINPALPIYSVDLMTTLLAESVAQRRFVLMLIMAFSALALALAALGIYGVITYMTLQRTREIGIRTALGAGRSDLLRLVLGQGFRIAVIGVAAGLAAALGLTRFLSGMLYGVGHTDPATFATMSLLLVVMAVFASWVPARRAMRIEPAAALRHE